MCECGHTSGCVCEHENHTASCPPYPLFYPCMVIDFLLGMWLLRIKIWFVVSLAVRFSCVTKFWSVGREQKCCEEPLGHASKGQDVLSPSLLAPHSHGLECRHGVEPCWTTPSRATPHVWKNSNVPGGSWATRALEPLYWPLPAYSRLFHETRNFLLKLPSWVSVIAATEAIWSSVLAQYNACISVHNSGKGNFFPVEFECLQFDICMLSS